MFISVVKRIMGNITAVFKYLNSWSVKERAPLFPCSPEALPGRVM